ncbi:MAG: glycosyl hydrolase 53 family protein [Bacteroidales bacterium]|nr:glycosyl hydrolase 53 family protein [Bacteroidales bacterium]
MSLTIARAETTEHFVGGDISLLPSYEEFNTPYYDQDGKTISDVITYVHESCGWNAIRVRLFVDPKERGNGKSGVVQDLAYVKKLGKRVKDAGMKLMVDFHYSDCWADPSYQDIPARWKGNTSNDVLADSVYTFTKNCLTELKAYGAEPDFVQVGNEISYGMLWRNNSDKVYPSQSKSSNSAGWARLSQLLNSGSKAVREVCPDCKIIIHTERTENSSQTTNYYNYISDVDYDIIGLSYYPFWHNSLAKLGATLTSLQSKLPDKPVQIVETAYFYQYYPNDTKYNFQSTWPATEDGQCAFTQDLVAELLKHDNANGLFWWFPEENGNGGPSWNANTIVIDSWLNRGLWNDNNHKALSALYELQKLRSGDAAISIVSSEEESSWPIYNLHGKAMEKDFRNLPSGIYIVDGRKILLK